MSKIKLTITMIIIILVLTGIGVGSYLMDRVAPNPPGTVGNTAGNLQNGGLFCENEGKVYFSNPYDSNTLYSMNPDETEIEKLNSMAVKWINAAGKYLYFYQYDSSEGSGLGYVIKTTGMYRMNKNGNGNVLLKRDAVGEVTLIDNQIFYQNLSDSQISLDRISIDKKNSSTVLDAKVSISSVYGGSIYYSNYNDGLYLYALDTTTGMNRMIWNHPVWNPVYHSDGYIYFMDLETDYQLHRYHPVSGSHEVLTTDRVDMFNIAGDLIYYQKSSENDPALMRMYTYGGSHEVVSSGVYHNINITSNNVYFTSFDAPTPIYRQSIYGPVNVTIFQPVLEEK